MSTIPPDTLDGLPGVPTTEELPNRERAPATGPAPAVQPGGRIARYLVLEELGAGTMGVVYAAHDPELDRKIAIKLLKSRREDQAQSRLRLQREAQALAKLDHRNVVGVYDVGLHDGQLFLAMEFVEGQTLRGWMMAEARPWSEVVRVLSEAGRGLAAAHGVGFVHRDFKPDNVMIDESGRVRVMDFGLARAEIHDRARSLDSNPELDELAELPKLPRLSGWLTQTGTVMGTPSYMARELFDGQPADARSDQFAFCVTLYEALYGERPFAGDRLSTLLRSVAAGHVNEAPTHAKVPPWLRRLVLRGLSPDPAARWPSMLDLLEALEAGPRRRRRLWLGIAASLGMAAALAWVVADWWEAARMCDDLGAPLEQVWNEQQRRALAARFAVSEVSYASDAWFRVERGLDHYAAAWLAARDDACQAQRGGEQSAEQRALRDACLDDRLGHLRATIDVLAHSDAAIIGRAVEMVSELPQLQRCADIDALQLDAPPLEYAAGATRVVELEQRLAEAEALEKAGKYRAGLNLTAEVVAAAQELHDERMLARARLREGILQRHAGDYAQAEAALAEAYDLALGLRMTSEAAEAAATMVFVVGYQLARFEDGRSWAVHAKPLARAAGTDAAQALYLNNVGAVAYQAGRYAEARAAWEQALELRERAFGPEHPKVAGSLNNLGVVAHAEGNYEEARLHHERALQIWTHALGSEHPQTSYSLNHLGRVAFEQGRYAEARIYHEHALRIREQALGPNHSLVADTLANLGQLAAHEGEHAEALADHERALAIYERVLGPEHPNVANASTERGRALVELGRVDEAIVAFERALAIRAGEEGDPTKLAETRFALAQALVRADPGARTRARELASLARAAYVAAGEKSTRELEAVDAWLDGPGN